MERCYGSPIGSTFGAVQTDQQHKIPSLFICIPSPIAVSTIQDTVTGNALLPSVNLWTTAQQIMQLHKEPERVAAWNTLWK